MRKSMRKSMSMRSLIAGHSVRSFFLRLTKHLVGDFSTASTTWVCSGYQLSAGLNC
jgi:hypothetical protein